MTEFGLWVGLIFSLILFSAILGDHAPMRLAQHILVGAALGYAALLTLREVLQPRLFALLLREDAADQWLWAPLVLGLLLMAAAFEALLAAQQRASEDDAIPTWRRLLRGLGLAPMALMLGVGISVALIGVVQGTLLPQLGQVIGIGPARAGPLSSVAGQAVLLLLTTATLLHLTFNPAQRLARQPAFVRTFFLGWAWLGKRALWIAAGVIFARLVAARLSLLIGWLEGVRRTLEQLGDWVIG